MRRLAALGLAALVVLLLVVAQLVLPGIAAQRVRDHLARSGQVLSCRSTRFRRSSCSGTTPTGSSSGWAATGTPGKLGSSLSQSGSVGSLDATATESTPGC